MERVWRLSVAAACVCAVRLATITMATQTPRIATRHSPLAEPRTGFIQADDGVLIIGQLRKLQDGGKVLLQSVWTGYLIQSMPFGCTLVFLDRREEDSLNRRM
jgi:hypothetical protein